MENSVIIEDFGPRVTSVWNGLRPATRNLVERAWRSPSAAATAEVSKPAPYDPRADRELSQLLAALDERAASPGNAAEDEPSRKARRLADACANMLTQQTQSADVFAQLIHFPTESLLVKLLHTTHVFPWYFKVNYRIHFVFHSFYYVYHTL